MYFAAFLTIPVGLLTIPVVTAHTFTRTGNGDRNPGKCLHPSLGVDDQIWTRCPRRAKFGKNRRIKESRGFLPSRVARSRTYVLALWLIECLRPLVCFWKTGSCRSCPAKGGCDRPALKARSVAKVRSAVRFPPVEIWRWEHATGDGPLGPARHSSAHPHRCGAQPGFSNPPARLSHRPPTTSERRGVVDRERSIRCLALR